MTKEQGQSVARQMGAIYVECSSKEMDGVHDVFELAVDTAVQREIKVKEERDRWAANGGSGTTGGMRRLKKRRCAIL